MCATADALRKFADRLEAGEPREDIAPLLLIMGWALYKRAKRSRS